MLTPNETFAMIARREVIGQTGDEDGTPRNRIDATEPRPAKRRRIDLRSRASGIRRQESVCLEWTPDGIILLQLSARPPKEITVIACAATEAEKIYKL